MDLEKKIEDVLGKSFDVFKGNYVAFIVGSIIAVLGSIFIITAPPLVFGVFHMANKAIKGNRVEIADVFKGFDYFITSWVMAVVALVAITFGLVLLVIPGIFLMIVFQYAIPIALDRKKGAIDSLQASYELGKNNFKFSAVLWVVLAVINMIGSSLQIGWVITVPFSAICMCVAMAELTKTAKPKALPKKKGKK